MRFLLKKNDFSLKATWIALKHSKKGNPSKISAIIHLIIGKLVIKIISMVFIIGKHLKQIVWNIIIICA